MICTIHPIFLGGSNKIIRERSGAYRILAAKPKGEIPLWGDNMKTYLQEAGGTRWRSWLRHCATNRKVAGSIPDIGIFH